jgi:ribosomal protein L22
MSTPTIVPPNTPVKDSSISSQVKFLEGNADETKEVQPPSKEVSKEEPEAEVDDKNATAAESEDELNLDDSSEEDELSLDSEDETSEELDLPGRINFKEVKKDFPDLLKKFPQLQANYFKAEQYTEIFPTVDEAKGAAQKAEIFDVINNQILDGDISLILNAVESDAPKALNRIAETILPDLYKKSPQLYSAAMAPEIKKLVRTAIAAGEKSGNENLKNAALVLQEYVFGPGGPPADKAPEREDPEKIALKNQNNQMFAQQANSYEKDTKEFAAKHLVRLIEADLDPKGEMSDFVREKTVESILEDVNNNLAKNPTLAKEMQAYWKKAAQSGFPAEMKPVITRAFLARAKLILPAIKQKRRAEVFGKKMTTDAGIPKKTNIRQSSGPTKSNSPVVSKTEIRKENLSPMDVIMRGAS